MRKLVFLVTIILVAVGIWACDNWLNGTSENAETDLSVTPQMGVDDSHSPFDVQWVIEILADPSPSDESKKLLESLTDSEWQRVYSEIERQHIQFSPEGGFKKLDELPDQPPLITCTWNGTTRWNQSLTQSRGYLYQGHHAVYFTVDANAACYSKNADWWVLTWTPTHGDVHQWYLLLHRDRYWDGSRWAKDVVLLVPTTWWDIYYPHWPSWFKAGRFYIHWYHQNNGCCE